MKENRTFTFPNMPEDKDAIMNWALDLIGSYRSAEEVELLKKLLDSMADASKDSFVKSFIPLMLVANMFGTPRCLTENNEEKRNGSDD